VIPDLIDRRWMGDVVRDFPKIDTTGSFSLTELTYGPAFAQLIEELSGPDVQNALSTALQVDLRPFPRLVTVRGRVGARDGYVHTDSDWKVVSVLVYLNESWDQPGGRLRLLHDRRLDRVGVEVAPEWGTLIAFRRSENSWHGHERADGVRRAIQLNWVTNAEKAQREERRHTRSTLWKRVLGRPGM
jgi:hypothetical protein